MKLIRFSVCLLLAGCAARQGAEKPAATGNEKLSVVVAPSNSESDPLAIEFLAAVKVTKDELEMRRSLATDLQYGVDSSFFITRGADTLWPQYVMSVANGQPLQPQYIVSFQRSELANSVVEFRSNIKGLEEVNHEHVSFTANELKNPSK